jgi:hypothetical protein
VPIQKLMDLENTYLNLDMRIEKLAELVSVSYMNPAERKPLIGYFVDLWQTGTVRQGDSSDTELELGGMKVRTNDHHIGLVAVTAAAVLAGVGVGVWAGFRSSGKSGSNG